MSTREWGQGYDEGYKKGWDDAMKEKPAQQEQAYPDNFIDALKFDVAKRDSEAQKAYEDAFVNGTGVMLGDKRIDPASVYKEPEQEPVACPDGKQCKHGAWCTETYCQEHCEFRAPPQRKPLDTGEVSRLWKRHTNEDGPHHNPYDDDGLGFARAIEAAHGIK